MQDSVVAGSSYYGEYICYMIDDYRIMDFGNAEQWIDDGLYSFILDHAEPRTIAEQLAQIAENQQKVYDAGYARGYDDGESEGGGGYDEGFADGRQAEYDAFWDGYQLNGTRTNYQNAFRSNGWSDVNFKPKYGIKPTNAENMFTQSAISDFTKALGELEFDVSNASAVSFILSEIKYASRIPMVLDCRKAPNSQGLFYHSGGIETIDKIIVNEGNTFSAWFTECRKLRNITFEGVIGNSITSLGASTLLSKESIMNIITHLSDTAEGKTLTLSMDAVNEAFAVRDDSGNVEIWGGASDEWLDLIAPKVGTPENPKWIITLS
jgi:hypothetical protein